MIGSEIELPVADGVLSGVDFGGRGAGVLLVHGSGHNVPMTRPADLASIILGLLRDRAGTSEQGR